MIIKVVTIPHTAFAAAHLVQQLRHLGHSADLVPRVNPYSPHLYIIYGAASQGAFPRRYIVYQTEIYRTHHFTPRYLGILTHALAIWEYHPDNMLAYSHLAHKASIVTPGVVLAPEIVKNIPVLFYGWIEGSRRRAKMLDYISRFVPVKIVTNTLGPPMSHLLSRSRIVINLHYHDHSPLERFRVCEALSHRCHVISEGPEDTHYSGYVHFTRTTDRMVEIIHDNFHTPFTADISSLDNMEEIKKALSNISE